jgi:hypothetical protein
MDSSRGNTTESASTATLARWVSFYVLALKKGTEGNVM